MSLMAERNPGGRPKTTCIGLDVPPADRCPACANPKTKRPCLRKSGRWPACEDQSDAAHNKPTAGECTDQQEPAATHGSRASASAAEPESVTDAARDEEMGLKRQRQQPVPVYVPEDFYRPPLPEQPKRKAVQDVRAEGIRRVREQELEAARAEGAAEAAVLAERVAVEAKARLESMATELADAKAAAKAGEAALAAAEAQKRRDHAAKRQWTMDRFLANPLAHTARPRNEPEQLDQGYTTRNIASGCFAQHVRAIETKIIELCPDDPLKQLQLGAALNQRLLGIRSLRDRDQEAWGYIRNSLKAWFEKLQDTYKGRYPNHIRAAQQAVCSAIANACPPRKLHVISQELGVPVDQLALGRKHWSEWVNGDRESLMELRGKIRWDSTNEAWIEFAIGIWKDNTRRSERAKDSLRNPRDKSDNACKGGASRIRQGPEMVNTEKRIDPYQIRIGEERRRPAIS